ncbi:MAG: TetR/AcrR family transcriptional regulator [Lentimicrobium sp.]|nr:TetR/AcrR family transcriptional regulator [Lentimicrobium sp.]
MNGTKELIIEEARKIFTKYGFNKSSMSDIALAARKGRRTIYTYFTSKEEVFKAVIETEVSDLAEKLGVIMNDNIPADQKLRNYMYVRMNALKELTVYYNALREDFVNNLGMIENLRKDYDIMEIEMIRQMLDEGVTSGVFEIAEVQQVSRAILVAIKGFELPIFLAKDDYDYNQLIDPMIGLFFKGILTKHS